MEWLESDSFDATALAQLRQGTRTPIASCETLTGLRQLRPFLDHQAVDVVIVDAGDGEIVSRVTMGDDDDDLIRSSIVVAHTSTRCTSKPMTHPPQD